MKRIAIVMGGDSAEYAISLKSANVVYQHLDRNDFEPYLIGIRGSDWTCEINGNLYRVNRHDFSIQTMNTKITFDGVFIAIHGTPGENGILQGYFDLIELPYATCGALQAALTFNKVLTNDVLINRGFNCARSIVLHKGDEVSKTEVVEQLGLPCFVKPAEAGSSFGVSKVNQIEELESAIEEAFKHHHTVLIETMLKGREITCGVHNLNGTVEALPLTEIITENEFFDFKAKYEGASKEITPAKIDAETTLHIQEVAKAVYITLGMDAVCRVDFMVNDKGIPFIIEINTVPGLSEASIVPQMAQAAGYPLQDFFTNWTKHMFKEQI